MDIDLALPTVTDRLARLYLLRQEKARIEAEARHLSALLVADGVVPADGIGLPVVGQRAKVVRPNELAIDHAAVLLSVTKAQAANIATIGTTALRQAVASGAIPARVMRHTAEVPGTAYVRFDELKMSATV